MNIKACTTRELGAIDIALFKNALGVCPVDVTVLGSREPHAFLQSHHEPRSLTTLLQCEFAFRGRFSVPEGWFLFGYVLRASSGGWCHAIELEDDVAFLLPPGHAADFVLNSGTRIATVLLPRKRVGSLMAEAGLPEHELQRLTHLFRVPRDTPEHPLRDAYRQLWYSDSQTMRSDEDRAELLADTMRLHLTGAVDAAPASVLRSTRGRLRHYAIFCRTVQFMEKRLRDDIYVQQICDAAGVSERALRYAFVDLVGISPMRYLRMLRLCSACKALAFSDVARRSVKSIAIGCGLHDLSRFASAYNHAFGECPYSTLLRAPTHFRASA